MASYCKVTASGKNLTKYKRMLLKIWHRWLCYIWKLVIGMLWENKLWTWRNQGRLCKAQEKVQEYLDTNEGELLSQVSRFFRELCDLHSQEMKACQHMTKFKEWYPKKEESVKHAEQNRGRIFLLSKWNWSRSYRSKGGISHLLNNLTLKHCNRIGNDETILVQKSFKKGDDVSMFT